MKTFVIAERVTERTLSDFAAHGLRLTAAERRRVSCLSLAIAEQAASREFANICPRCKKTLCKCGGKRGAK